MAAAWRWSVVTTRSSSTRCHRRAEASGRAHFLDVRFRRDGQIDCPDLERLALFYHEDSLAHDTGSHPERIARMQAIEAALQRRGLMGAIRAPEPAEVGQITRVHAVGHVATVDRLVRAGGGALDVDTHVSPGSYRAATRAAGGAIAAAAAVARGDAQRAFAIGRPPGHHARPAAAMGFCLFNNVAVAARALQAEHGVGRLAIVDVDVHHGNGTQESFYDDPTVLFVSTHQYPFYPGSGALQETGSGPGRGATVNVPLPGGCGDAEYLAALDRVVLPALRAYQPEVLLVSIGYDAHWSDPLAQMRVTVSGYVAIVERLAAVADEVAGGRIALVLEGGYDLDALSSGVAATALALRGEPWQDHIGPPPGGQPNHVEAIAPILDMARSIHGLTG